MMVTDSGGPPRQLTVVPLSEDTFSVSVVRVEVRLLLLTAVIAAWNMNPSGPADDRFPIPSLPNMICLTSAVFTRSGGGVTVHRRLVLFTVQVKTTGSLGQAAPSPELDVN